MPTLYMPGPLTLPNYTFSERKPMNLIQTYDDNILKPATSTDKKIVMQNHERLFMTETEIELHKKIVAAKIQICKYNTKAKRQSAELRAARKFATNPENLNAIENCTTAAKILMQIQWRENSKIFKGRRLHYKKKLIACQY
ncbi:unnamed protein product [Parnassius apollo]|uniref:(apollo) hypothetical protein n=1 Tax=Parnassius apollo TaxID=110799 RepID=A0A8S3XF29_PARAO|nr:unnamed protein product [Parnassius apollo]